MTVSRKNSKTLRGRSFRAGLERSDNRLWGCHVSVPPNIARALLGSGSRRVVCTLNRSIQYQCALVPRGHARYVITVNKQIRKQLGAEFGDEVAVTLKPDKSQYGLPFPEELREVLRQDRGGNKLFHALPAGKQRTLLYIVGKGRNQDLRVNRALTIVEHLKTHHGKILYKQLSVSLRKRRAGFPSTHNTFMQAGVR